jgi:copper(I)-binding protein
MIPHLSVLAVAALVAGSASAASAAPVAVTDAWCRPAAAGAPSAACYLTLTARTDDSLVGVASPAAERVETHQMDMAGGIMRMKKVATLPLPAGKAVALQPGGLHLMLIRPKAALAAGGSTELTLRFAKAPAAKVRAEVRDPIAASAPTRDHRR